MLPIPYIVSLLFLISFSSSSHPVCDTSGLVNSDISDIVSVAETLWLNKWGSDSEFETDGGTGGDNIGDTIVGDSFVLGGDFDEMVGILEKCGKILSFLSFRCDCESSTSDSSGGGDEKELKLGPRDVLAALDVSIGLIEHLFGSDGEILVEGSGTASASESSQLVFLRDLVSNLLRSSISLVNPQLECKMFPVSVTWLESYRATSLLTTIVLSFLAAQSETESLSFAIQDDDLDLLTNPTLVGTLTSLYIDINDIVYRNWIQYPEGRWQYQLEYRGLLEEGEMLTSETEIQKRGWDVGDAWRVEIAKFFQGLFLLGNQVDTTADVDVVSILDEVGFVQKVFGEESWKYFLNGRSDQLMLPLLFHLARTIEGREVLMKDENRFALVIIGRLFLVGFYEQDVASLILLLLETGDVDEEDVFRKLVEVIEKERVLSQALYDVSLFLAPPGTETEDLPRQKISEKLLDTLRRKQDWIPSKYRSRLSGEMDRIEEIRFSFTSVTEQNERNKFNWVSRRIAKKHLSSKEIVSTVKKELAKCRNPIVIGMYYDVLYDAYRNLSATVTGKKKAAYVQFMLDYASKGLKMNRKLLGLVFKRAKLFLSVRKDRTFYQMELTYLQSAIRMALSTEPDYEKLREEYRTMVYPRLLLRRVNTQLEEEKLRKRELRYYLKYGPPELGTEYEFAVDLPEPVPFDGMLESEVCGESYGE